MSQSTGTKRVTFDLNSTTVPINSFSSKSKSASVPIKRKVSSKENNQPKGVGQTLVSDATSSYSSSDALTVSSTQSFDPRSFNKNKKLVKRAEKTIDPVVSFPKIVIPEPEEDYHETLQSCVRQGTRNLAGYFKGRIKTLTDIFGRESIPHAVSCDDAASSNSSEVYKVWKAKADTSKLVTRDDGNMYQKISQYVYRGTLFTPRDTSNMMDATSYTGVRITEGTYESGEKFTDI